MSFREKIGDNVIQGDFSRLERLIKGLSENHFVDIGIMGEQAAAEHPSGDMSVVEIGAVHEFGRLDRKPPIPKRSFILMPIETGQKEIEAEVEPRIEQHMADGDIKGIFKDIGAACEARIQKAFETGGFGHWRELADLTKELKGSDSILIDTGELRKSITSRVDSE